MRLLVFCVFLLAQTLAPLANAGVEFGTEVTFSYMGTERTYSIYKPTGLGEKRRVLLLLHGSGRRGESLIEAWKALADAEKVLLVAPNSAHPAEWSPYADPPPFFRMVLKDVEAATAIDRNRIYVFGHSAGAVWGLQLGLLAAKEMAAVAVHAGLIPEPAYPVVDQAKRKVPIQIQVGDRDPFFPVEAVRGTVDYLEGAGFSPELRVIDKHDHDYYSRAETINARAWEFLQKHSLVGTSIN